MKASVASFGAGALFAVGLGIAGMTKPALAQPKASSTLALGSAASHQRYGGVGGDNGMLLATMGAAPVGTAGKVGAGPEGAGIGV